MEQEKTTREHCSRLLFLWCHCVMPFAGIDALGQVGNVEIPRVIERQSKLTFERETTDQLPRHRHVEGQSPIPIEVLLPPSQ